MIFAYLPKNHKKKKKNKKKKGGEKEYLWSILYKLTNIISKPVMKFTDYFSAILYILFTWERISKHLYRQCLWPNVLQKRLHHLPDFSGAVLHC